MIQPAVLTTSWDDGHPLDQHIAELLAKYDLTGTFYIPLENSRPVMAEAQIRQLSEAFEVGAHTIHHAVLTEVADGAAEREIRESKKRLEDITGRHCVAFCFPKGRFRCSHLAMVRRAGFRCARTVELLSTQFPSRRADICVLPTTVQARCQDWTVYVKNCAKRFATPNLVNFIFHARSRNWLATAQAMLHVVVRHGGVFHLWGHSWEIEEQQQWTQLEAILRELRELRAIAPCMSNSWLARLGHKDRMSTNGRETDPPAS